jgi:MFS family permease
MSNPTNSQAVNQGGIQGYLAKMKLFSRNARLYLLHVIGMDLIHGTWEVLFNLYLLAVGFGADFIALRLLIMGMAGSIASIPMGWLSDKLGRKAGFILGDGGGAVISLIQILSINPVVLLVAPAIGSMFGALHHVTEPAFMAENSRRDERIHLFSVSEGLRTLSVMVGSLIAGFLPLWAAGQFGISKVDAYRYATFIGIAWWFLSLIPAVLLKQNAPEAKPESSAKPSRTISLKAAWSKVTANIKNPVVIKKLLLVNGLISLGAGFVIPLMNVFLHEGIDAHEHEIGMMFAAGSLFLAIGALLIPFVVERFGKVPTVAVTRFAAIPFILIIGLAPDLANPTVVVSIAGFAYILRTTLFNMAGPVFSAFSMELLDKGERATVTGMQSTVGRVLAAGAGFLGATLMALGDFRTPFFLMTFFFLISTVMFWVLFRPYEKESKPQLEDGAPVEA